MKSKFRLNEVEKSARQAREASRIFMTMSHAKRQGVLRTISRNIQNQSARILSANARDCLRAQNNRLSNAMIGRLKLDRAQVRKISQAVLKIAALPDPLGRVLQKTRRPNGLVIEKRSVPLGVLLIIFESRPNVTIDCAALAIKSGNAVVLKGGREAAFSNEALAACVHAALRQHQLPVEGVQLIRGGDRQTVHRLLQLPQWIDVVIPRGGEGLIRKVAAVSKIPVIKHYKGICHVYVDRDADLRMALRIAENAKVQNPGVCNTMETLLIDDPIAKAFLPPFAASVQKKGVELRGCPRTRRILKGIRAAKVADWSTEYLDLILSLRVVDGYKSAVRHIQTYGSAHSDAIVSQNKKTLEAFLNELDSACVFANASTRFSDGGEFGMGAEIGISTDKLHARGPMGLGELTTYKYVIRGKGQIRE